jgi:hypothetical protein
MDMRHGLLLPMAYFCVFLLVKAGYKLIFPNIYFLYLHKSYWYGRINSNNKKYLIKSGGGTGPMKLGNLQSKVLIPAKWYSFWEIGR